MDNISFSVKSGSIHGLLGHNGAGKTTLFRIILCLLNPAKGSVKIFGTGPKVDPSVKLRIGYVAITIVMITIVGDAFLSYILRGFVLSLVFALPLCYVLFLNTMAIPSKYSSLLPMLLILVALLPMQGIYSMFGTGPGLSGIFTLSTIIASIVLIAIGLAETIIIKDKIVELATTM